MDLPLLFAALARDTGLIGYVREDLVLSPEERASGKGPSRWVVLARSRADLGALPDDPRWRRLTSTPGIRTWADDFSNLLSLIGTE